MRRAERLLQMLQILRRHRRPVTGEAIARELEVSLRTVYRDIASLISDRVPIRGEAGVGYVLGEGFDLPPLMFTPDELEAVMLGLRGVSRRSDGKLLRAAQDTVAKIGAVLPERLKPFLFDAGLMVPQGDRVFRDTVDVAQLRNAIREGRIAVPGGRRQGDTAHHLAHRCGLLRCPAADHRVVRIAPGFPLVPYRPDGRHAGAGPKISRAAQGFTETNA